MHEIINRQVAWNRLIGIVEEQAQTLIRVAFSTTVREAGDLSAGVFDTEGRMLAQAVTGTPGHVNAMAAAVGHVLHRHPLESMRSGDAFTTNDPWRGTGHLNDFTMVTPIFRGDVPVGLVASTTHMVDVGGLGFGTDGTNVHEGIFVPIMPLAHSGTIDATLMKIILANVRNPIEVEGDLYALMACNDVCGRRVLEMIEELRFDGLAELGAFIRESSERGMRNAIRQIPEGVYENAMTIDGIDTPIELRATMRVRDGAIAIDFGGTSAIVGRGINVPMIYTEAMASFGVRCVIGGAIPNNAGSLKPVTVTAPKGCVLNAPYPAPVSARHVVGQMIPDVILGCLAKAVPERVPAEGSSALWILVMAGGKPGGEGDERMFAVNCFHNGGTGARPGQDGLSATAFPSGVRAGSVEVTEAGAPLVYWRKAFRGGSGGEGAFRGGLGQTIEVGHLAGETFNVSCLFDRVIHPARGRFGGDAGALGSVRLGNGTMLAAKGRQNIPAGETVIFETPGGGGLGDESNRAPERIAQDRREGFLEPALQSATGTV